ncbi:hypothetical protein [Cylindrospermopsis sp. CR12]|uniref:hypothetical protein n=1 Tax=Cylindrospermopsis sp. CR12 TaxID=1747196 RepID=UPI001F216166|nr:hypothetical protein [Cylindrospermopsis sp. CR12]
MLLNDCAALPAGDCAALPTGDRSHLGSFHVRFLVGKRLTVNVFRQRINQLFQGVGIFGGGLRSTSDGRLRSTPYGRSRSTRYARSHSVFPPDSFSREKPERVDERLRSTPDGRLRSTPYGRSLSSRHVSCSVPGW